MKFAVQKITDADFIEVFGEDAEHEGAPDFDNVDALLILHYTETPAAVMNAIFDALNGLDLSKDYAVYNVDDGSDTHIFAIISA